MKQNYKEEMQNLMKQAKKYESFIQDECDHKNGKRPSTVLLNKQEEQNMITSNNQGWSPSALRCTDCGTIYEQRPYKQIESQAGIRMFHSMVNQYKSLTDLTEESSKQMVMDVQQAVRTLEKFTIVYTKFTKDLTKKDDHRGNNNNNRRSGGYGIGSSNFRRGY